MMKKNLDNTQNQQSNTAGVMPSTFGYRFSVTSNRNNEILGTGFFKSSRKMTRDELLNFFHQYTHGKYQKEESFVSIDIFEAEA
jgi:hypothetical protein